MSNSDTALKNVTSASSDLKTLLSNVNDNSSSTRLGWIAFITLSAILFVILSAVKDHHLLLKAPVVIPLINLSVPLKTFFLVMPGIYIFAHFSILLQNVLLAQKVEIFDTNVSNLEELNKVTVHPIRFQLNSYFMTQVIAGPTRHKAIGRYLDDISWISLTVLPQLLLIYFLITFLPFHDIFSTWIHRFYILLDIFVILTISTYFTAPLLSFSGALWDTVKYYPFRTIFSTILVGVGLFFTFAIATIPGELVERKLLPFNILAPSFIINSSEDSFFLTSLIFGDKNGEDEKSRVGLFRRNLFLTDRNFNELKMAQNGESRVNLRARDLRYATFNRSNIVGGDFTHAKLQGATFINASLKDSNFNHATLDGARFIDTNLNGSTFTETKAFGTNFTRASLNNAFFKKSGIIASNFSNAHLAGVNFNDAKLHGSHFYKADLRASTFINSWLIGVSFSDANLQAADLSKGPIWESVPPSQNQLIDLKNRKLLPPSKNERRWIIMGLNQIHDKSLRTKIMAILSPVMNTKSASLWRKSLDYQQWKTLIQQKSTTNNPLFQKKISKLLANISCSETASESYLTTSIIRRITATYLQQPTYNGDAENYLRQTLTQHCPAFHRVSTSERQKLYDSVLQGRSLEELRPTTKIKPSVPVVQAAPPPPSTTVSQNNTSSNSGLLDVKPAP